MRIVVLYDNNLSSGDYRSENSNLKEDWGFSCYIDTGENKILFDTGGKGNILLNNMRVLGIDPKEVDTVFLSHSHNDHTGGLVDLLDNMENKLNTIIYLLPSFPEDIKKIIRDKGFLYSEIIDFSEIRYGVYSTGPMEGGNIGEHAMIIRSENGMIIVSGCAHPGIINIVKKVHEWFPNEKIYLVMGGFHMIGYSDDEIMDVITFFKSLGVEKVMPCHCTGDRAKSLFISVFKNDCLICGVGRIVNV